jgi:hypothetical protein
LFLGFRTAGGKGIAQTAFESGDHAFDLPTLAVKALGKTMSKLLTIATSYRTRMPARVEREDRPMDVELVATEPMMRLRVESGVSQQSSDRRPSACLPYRRWQERRIIAGATRHDGRQQQMAAMVAHQRELQPRLVPLGAATPPQKMRAGMVVFQPRGINAGSDMLHHQPEFVPAFAQLIEQLLAPPFLASRWAAFWRVVK